MVRSKIVIVTMLFFNLVYDVKIVLLIVAHHVLPYSERGGGRGIEVRANLNSWKPCTVLYAPRLDKLIALLLAVPKTRSAGCGVRQKKKINK